jgi:uncharacterized repeat protein (TIGR03803 family)
MRITSSGCGRLALALVLTLMCAGSAVAATEKVLHNFSPLLRGWSPNPGLLSDAAGNLYGTTYAGGSHSLGTVFKLTQNSQGAWTEHVLYNFTGASDGDTPSSGLISDQAGNLYGTTNSGTHHCCGNVFKLAPSGNSWKLSVLYKFTGHADGGYPSGNLVLDAAGNLYGTAESGGNLADCGSIGCGTIFKLAPTSGSWTFNVLYSFTGGSDGANPNGGLIFDQAGALYGTTADYGTMSCPLLGCGAVFKLAPSGNSWAISVLYDFTGGADGSNPLGPLVFDQAGNLYGAASGTQTCTPPNCGLIFELKLSGGTWTKSVLYAFTGGADGAYPLGRLIFDHAGNLYGAAAYGGSSACGTVFQLTPSGGGWTQSVLHSFKGVSDGCFPDDVTLAASGTIFGTASFSGPGANGLVFQLTSASGSWKESTVSPFLGSDGSEPEGGLIFDTAGSLYGTTYVGGTAGLGAVFKMTPNSQGGWTESMLYSFKNTASGEYPMGNVVFDNRNLYGTTSQGGSTSSSCPKGCGTVFKLTPSGAGWSQSVIRAFSGADGISPAGSLVLDSTGNLYGTAGAGGAFGFGGVFQLAPSSGGAWTETVLYSFTGGMDGSGPAEGVVFDQAGNLYGVTGNGGAYGAGTIFKLAPSSGGTWKETVIYSFSNGLDGSFPQGPLVFDEAGNLYGTTLGGSGSSYATIFQLSPAGGSWTLNVVDSSTNGQYFGPVIVDAAGNLYGSVSGGGNQRYGSVFQLKPGSGGWTATVLHTFAGGRKDGAYVSGTLARDAAGNLYGNSPGGGTVNAGVVFEIVP